MTRLAVAHRTPDDAASVRALTASGANVLEVDVRLHRGALLAVHGRPFRRPRLQGGTWSVGIDPRTPELDAVLALVPDDAEVLLDLKDDRADGGRRLAGALRGRLPARVYASSHDWASLSLLAADGVRTWRTVGSRRALDRLLAVGLQDAWGVTVRRTLLDDATADRLLERAGGRVVAWTVNDPEQARRLLRRGLLGITTDSDEVLRVVREGE